MKFKNYLAFENALEAIAYYQDRYQATVKEHQTLTTEIIEELDLVIDDLSKTTYSAMLNVFGVDFQVSDRVEPTGEFSDSVNMVVEFSNKEFDLFCKYVSLIQEDKDSKLLFENLDALDLEYKMYRFKDKYNIIWALIINS